MPTTKIEWTEAAPRFPHSYCAHCSDGSCETCRAVDIDGYIKNEANRRFEQHMDDAEHKAWDALGRYKFQMFGYWAAIWVHLNQISGLGYDNPFRDVAQLAAAKRRRRL